MLKIIMGSEKVSEFINTDNFIEFTNSYFNARKKPDWFDDNLVKDIIRQIDKAEVINGYAVKSIEYDTGYSVDDISGGSKTLILILKRQDKIYLATMGDNCTDFLEQIAVIYEKQGKDLVVVENYMHHYNFKFIQEIQYMNWGIICRNASDIQRLIVPKWYEQEKTIIGVDNEPTEEEMNDIINSLPPLEE